MDSIVHNYKDQILNLIKSGKSQSEVSKFIRDTVGLKKSTANHWAREYFLGKVKFDSSKFSVPEKVYSFTEKGNDATIEKITNERVQTLEDLIRVCEIDLTIWFVERYECSAYESHTRLRRYNTEEKGSSGYFRLDDEHLICPLFRVKAYLKRNTEKILQKNVLDDFKEELKSFSPKVLRINYPKHKNGVLLEISPFDLHIGKLAWEEETGQNYDRRLAEQAMTDAVNYLLGQASFYNIEQIVFPIGQDFLHVDTLENTTTHLTRQDCDSRAHKTYREGRKLLVKIIDQLKQIAPVQVIVVPGNHETFSMFHLGDAIECWYHNDKNVVVNNAASHRKYHLFGKNLIGFCHGNTEKISSLPLIMATEKPKEWNDSIYREFHLGHFHSKKDFWTIGVNEFRGVRVCILPSLSASDAWHSSKGYSQTRAAEAFIFDKTMGRIANFSYNIL